MMDQEILDHSVLSTVNLTAVNEEKRAAAEEDLDSGFQFQKKMRTDGGGDDLRRVAEIVMVLSAMGKMRGGRGPSRVERGLMAEAREKLARMCESVAPKDLLPRDAVRAVQEDLGFNKLRDTRFGFRPPTMTIAEKASFMMKKIEESKEGTAQSAMHLPQQMQAGIGSRSDGHDTVSSEGVSHGHPSGRTSSVPQTSGGFQPASPVVFVSALPPPSSVNQSQVAVMQPAFVLMPSFSGPSESVTSSAPLPQMEAAHFRLDGQPAYLFQVQANSSGNHLSDTSPTTTFSQSPLAAVANAGEVVKPMDHTPAMPQGAQKVNPFQPASQSIKDHSSIPSAVQMTSSNTPSVHQPMQAMNFVPPSLLYSNHNDIAKNIHKLLQQRHSDHANWTTPPINYMTEPLTCQMCKVSITDVESLLVCDACEKGVHLKCLQSYHIKGIPKGDWHCPKCLMTSNGRPLPPKYGRVTRNVRSSKVSSNNSGVEDFTEKMKDNPVQKVNHQKTTDNGKSSFLKPTHTVSTWPTGNNNMEPGLDQKNPNARDGVDLPAVKMEDDPSHGFHSDCPVEKTGYTCAPAGTVNESGAQHIQSNESSPCHTERLVSAPESQPDVELRHPCPNEQSDTGVVYFHQPQASSNSPESDKPQVVTCVEVSKNQLHDSDQSAFEEFNRPDDVREHSECKPASNIKEDDQVVRVISNASENGIQAGGGGRSSLNSFHGVDWIGDALQIVDDKAYYSSCCINGAVYKLQDHALCSNNGNLSPVKLEVLWEDNINGSKWAIVNQCYFPSDLPEVVGRPSTPENNEVYGSNHQSTIMVGSIHSPCEVLPPDKFKEESERRTSTGNGANYGFHPIFLCNWFYDETKGLLQHVAK